MDIGLLSAFIGGILALLSPCAALLMPAFFASTVGRGPRLVLHAGVFYLGLIAVLVPLGLGAGALGAAFVTHRQTIVALAALVLIILGLTQILGFGFDPARLLPARANPHTRAAARSGFTKTALLGAASGIAGFCAGPILGAVLTLAAARGDIVMAAAMLASYGAGMVVPLVLLASVWRRIGPRAHRALRGREFSVLGRRLHTTSVLTGALMIVVGVIFWTTNGLVGAPELLPWGAQAWLQSEAAVLGHPLVDVGAIAVAAATTLVLLHRRRSRIRRQTPSTPDQEVG